MRLALVLFALPCAAQWQPAPSSVRITPEGNGIRLTHSTSGEFSLLSTSSEPAKPGDVFEVSLRIRVDEHTVALPELACFDTAGAEIPVRSSLEDFSNTTTTNWQLVRRTYVARPGTATVRARLRASGRGQLWIEPPTLQKTTIDSYRTGALYTAMHPRLRRGLVLESNLGIVNRALLSPEDRDGDGKWAELFVDLDSLSKLEESGSDWRTRFEYKPNEIYWSDGAVLKSDSILADREPSLDKALHFRIRAHRGPYKAILNDPGRSIAISTDGKRWRRFEGGSELNLGTLPAPDGFIELWLDACYRDPLNPGPVYFDYIRLLPAIDTASEGRIFRTAVQNAPPSGARFVERKVPLHFHVPPVPFPIRCGIPIPKGELASAGHAAILDQSGRPVPSQNRDMATWPDGTVKWLYLDFLSRPNATYSLAYYSRLQPAPPANPVRTQRTPNGLQVDTGAVRFLVPSQSFHPLENAAIEITETSGRVWRAGELPVTRLEVEQAGPIHTVILVETELPKSGAPAKGFYHRARIHVYAGSPIVDVDYFIANTDSRGKVTIRSITLKLPTVTTGSGAHLQPDDKPGPPSFLQQPALSLGIEAFREQYPKAIRWGNNQISIDLWAPEGGDFDWIQGVGKTHRLRFDLSGATNSPILSQGPIYALADPEWYTASGAFGPISSAARSPLPAVEATLNRHMDGPVIAQIGTGFENFGDHSSSGYVKGSYLWDNNEYDLPAAAIIHFARTGDEKALRSGLASALHYLDVDTIHYSADHSDWAGAAHTHSHGSVGHHTADAPNMHHAGYVQGLILYSYFTGEPTGIQGARGIADWALRNLKPESNIGQMERAAGHPLTTLNDVYEATWEERYLHGSARLVDWVLKWEHPERGGFLAPITEQPAYYSGSTFNSGLLYTALLKFNSWAKLPELDNALERTARWTLTDMWRPGFGIMSKGGSPRRGADPQNISTHLPLMRFALARTADPLFLALPRDAILAGFISPKKEIGTRSTGLVYNYLPQFLPVLAEWGAPDPAVTLTAPKELAITRGATQPICATVRNTSAVPMERLRATFQPRPDFQFTAAAAPQTLAPGTSAELCATLTAPAQINLTSDHNRISYAHWVIGYWSQGAQRTAHTWLKLALH